MKLGTALVGGTTRAFRQDDSGTFFYAAGNVDELLRDPLWREQSSEPGEAPAPGELTQPVIRPGKVICVGLNYHDHAAEVGKQPPDVPTLFSKVATALIGPRDEIELPPLSSEIDWEAELAVVIGSQVKRASEQQAREAILGYTVLNDVSVRDWQRRTSEWFQGKNFDRSTPVGPVIVTADELDPSDGLRVQTIVNDRVEQDGTTSNLIFGAVDLVVYLSQFLTLEPGDMIATGTPGGVGFVQKPPRFLRSGDVMTTRIEGIGDLVNTIRLGEPHPATASPESRTQDTLAVKGKP
ncbi:MULTISPECIES: fumarylacetoacetate hydrolase family protein [unclassified Microbacterium]|uniref:fumarylacetoacetate hydrolase family protein n=1 Tax=unclassified Microbacterium TaxID=2609290 RepID=UPI0013D4C531|nr:MULTISPECIES: fumarylacetoacetate hydrolase family protein [unclassified Microbacterium]